MDKQWLRLSGITPIMLLLSVFSFLQGLAIIAQALLLSHALTQLFNGAAVSDAVQPILLFAAMFVLRHTFVWLQQRFAGRFAEKTTEALGKQLLSKLFKLGSRFAASEGSGKIVNLALEGIVRVRTYLELSIPRMIDMLIITGAIWLAVIRLDLISGIILLVAQPVLIIFFIILGLAARSLADKQWRSYRILSQHFSDTLRGLETLRFLGRSKAHAGTVERVAGQYRKATMRTLRVAFLSSFSLDFFSMLSIAFVAVGLGVRLIDGGIQLEAALAILLLAPEYFMPIRMLGTDYHATLDGKEAWASIRAITEKDTESEGTGSSQYAIESSAASGRQVASESHNAAPNNVKSMDSQHNSTAMLRLSDVTVLSSEGRELLGGVQAEVAGGARKIGIVGESGAGKSTLLHVLGGFLQPSAGMVQADGEPLAGEKLAQWQQQLAYIPQHPYIFSMTLKENIAFYEPDASDEEIERAIDAAELRSLVEQLPLGIHERIGEGGRAVSGGQAQRIALARAWLGNRPMLLLDEPTAHLDVETEWELKQTMLRIFSGKTVFLATHRLHWMKDMDEVWVIKKGKLAEKGTHAQLAEQNGVYAKLLAAGRGEEL